MMSTDSNPEMRMLTLKISSREQTSRRVLQAMRGDQQGTIISFETPALLFSVLTRKRWELVAMMTGAGAMSIREAARRIGRDVKAVHGDISALLNAGVLARTDGGQVVFPFDAVHVDFMLEAA